MKQMQQGFTLIELMIVVAIIGILAAVAVPQYQNYTVRGQVTEGLAMASEFKTAVSEYRAARGRFPADNVEAGLGTDVYGGNYVSAISVASAAADATSPVAITITYGGSRVNSAITDNQLQLRGGTNAAGGVIWACGYAPAPAANTGDALIPPQSTAGTAIPAVYLPSDCRA